MYEAILLKQRPIPINGKKIGESKGLNDLPVQPSTLWTRLDISYHGFQELQAARELGTITTARIVDYTCKYFNMPEERMRMKTRKREVVVVRQVISYVSQQFTNDSLESIGAAVGGKDHSTMVHSRKTIEDLLETDKSFKEKITPIISYFQDIKNRINAKIK